jgi:hypothetical protein
MLIIMLMKLLTLLSHAMVMLSAPSAFVKMLLYWPVRLNRNMPPPLLIIIIL